MGARFRPGDCVIYRKPKYSVHPGPHARGVYPTPHGDHYAYYVDKYWTVVAVQSDHQLVVCTRRGKQHTLKADDPALRRVRWWEWFLFRQRFPSPTTQPEAAVENQEQGNGTRA